MNAESFSHKPPLDAQVVATATMEALPIDAASVPPLETETVLLSSGTIVELTKMGSFEINGVGFDRRPEPALPEFSGPFPRVGELISERQRTAIAEMEAIQQAELANVRDEIAGLAQPHEDLQSLYRVKRTGR